MSVTHTSWNLPIDKTLFTNTFRAESDWYNRKVGIVSTILFGGFAVAYIWALVWSAKTGVSLDVSGDPYLYAIVIVGMAVFAVFVGRRRLDFFLYGGGLFLNVRFGRGNVPRNVKQTEMVNAFSG